MGVSLSPETQQGIVAHLEAHPRGLTVLELSADLKISRNTMAKYLELLSARGYVELRRVGPAKVWTVSHALTLDQIWEHSSTTAIAVLDKSLKVVKANQAFLRLIQAAEIPPGSPVERYLWFWEHPIDQGHSLAEHVLNALDGHDVVLSEKQIPARDGGELLLDLQVRPALIGGERGVTLIFEDLTPLEQMRVAVARRNQEILQSEQRAHQILDNLRDGVVILDDRGRVTLINSAARELLGQGVEGKIITRRLAPASRKPWRQRLDQTLSQRQPARLALTLANRGREVEVDASLAPVTGADGVTTEVLVTLRVKREVEQLEQDLVLCASRFRALAESPDLVVWTMDRDRRVTMINPRGLELLGRSAEDAEGKTPQELFRPEVAAVTEARSRPVWEQGVSTTFTLPVHLAQGEEWYRMTLSPVQDDEGQVVGLTGMALNITEERMVLEALRDSETRLQAFLDNSQAVICLKDREGRFLLVNRTFEQLFHVTREAIAGQTIHDLFPPEMADACRANDLKVLAAGEPLSIEEISPQDDGLHTYISLKFPLCDAQGMVYAVGSISTDITERKCAESALRESEERYRQPSSTPAMPSGPWTARRVSTLSTGGRW